MVGIEHSVNSIKAIGYNSSGKINEFEITCDGELYCYHCNLISLDIPEGVKKVWCFNNLLTELILPEGVKYIWCNNNKLTELDIPSSVKELRCDRNVKDLDKIDWKCDIKLF